ncbi:hypothetical protein GCM10010168_32240 [Actinoplanes ianthinogenes]|uniref:PD-(D/E)XK endonuclease-like domain-containing protein n=1 Tax=Actinoplanes ianthinogenes TaxID=122358 RepID=A0ABM7LM97_9ACTN|nr:hypothetical protein Aiant_10220 [Actinoplanes ianthinogenes]GGR11726.1 hypothetical protein GCM10010168_32240 [Actinoplanes ianthinogenes]
MRISSYLCPSLAGMTAQTVFPPPQPRPGGPASPATSAGRPGLADRPSGPSLSPSRAADFKTCPLLFRFRTIDKLPEQPSADQVRGTLVHAVLERLFDLPAAERTPEAAAALVTPEWERLVSHEPALASLFAADPGPRSPTPAASGPLSPGPAIFGTPSAPPATPGVATPAPSDAAPISPESTPSASSPAPSGTASDAPTPALASPESTPSASGPAPSDTATGAPALASPESTSSASGPALSDAAPAAAVPSGTTTAGPAPATGASSGAAGVGHATDAVRDPAAVAAEADAMGQIALIDAPAGAAEAARLAAFLGSARDLLGGYFAVEDPQRLEPAERETLISTMIDDELLIRGYIDRLDVSPAGDLRVVDYKTGGAPREAFEGRALFQLKFYALVLWRTRGVVPRVLRLLYLKDAEVLDYSPEAAELERFERTLVALSQAVERAKRDREFRPKPSRLCGWCNHQALCPEFGGTPPPFPESPAAGLPADSEPDRLATTHQDDLVA